MSGRDRPNPDRDADYDYRRDPRDSERAGQSSSTRRQPQPYPDEDPFEVPAWTGESSRSTGRTNVDRPDATTRSGRRESAPRTSREPLPSLEDAARRPVRRGEQPVDDRSSGSTRDPYDRMRSTPAKQQRAVSFEDDPYADAAYGAEFDDGPYPGAPVPTGGRRGGGRRGATQERASRQKRASSGPQLGGMIAAAPAQTRLVAGTAGIVLVSLVIMAATVAGRSSAMPNWYPIHLNAEGTADLFGTPATLWRIPLMAFMMSVMSGAVGWYLFKHDAFAARFAIVSTLLIHAMCWIALANLVL